MTDLHSPSIDKLFQAVLSLRSTEECYAFFEDLCTVKELKDMAQRLSVALLLNDGMSYQSVTSKVQVSSATITRVKKCLEYGSGGYELVIGRMQEETA